MEKYRIIKICFQIGNSLEDYTTPQYIERYEVQVKGVFWWHTVKNFKKIRPAYRLLTILKEKEDEA